jgi:hypothetical protein
MKFFNPKKLLLKLSEILSGIFIPDPDLDFFTHPGSRGEKGTGSRVRNTAIKDDPIKY